MNYALTLTLIGSCMLFVAWSDYSSGNRRDSKLSASIGIFTIVAGAGIFATAS